MHQGLVMSQPRYHPRHVRLWKIGSKCVDDQFLLTPTPALCTLVCLFLAKMQELYDVKVVGVVFMGNHFHLLLMVYEDRLPDVMRDFKGGLAKAVNALLGRRGLLDGALRRRRRARRRGGRDCAPLHRIGETPILV